MDRGVEESGGVENAHPRLTKVISINGEEVDTSNMDCVNIHDFATFEQEQYLTNEFNTSIRRRTYPSKDCEALRPFRKQLSFQEVAQAVVRAENVLLALKHYHHRSDSESEEEEIQEPDQTKTEASQATESKGDKTVVDTRTNINNNQVPLSATAEEPNQNPKQSTSSDNDPNAPVSPIHSTTEAQELDSNEAAPKLTNGNVKANKATEASKCCSCVLL